jgi:hypothetical protein
MHARAIYALEHPLLVPRFPRAVPLAGRRNRCSVLDCGPSDFGEICLAMKPGESEAQRQGREGNRGAGDASRNIACASVCLWAFLSPAGNWLCLNSARMLSCSQTRLCLCD